MPSPYLAMQHINGNLDQFDYDFETQELTLVIKNPSPDFDKDVKMLTKAAGKNIRVTVEWIE